MHCNYAGKVPPLDRHLIFMMFVYIFSTHVITLFTRFDICSSGKVNSGKRYPNRVVSFGLNRAYIMKIRTPNTCCTDQT